MDSNINVWISDTHSLTIPLKKGELEMVGEIKNTRIDIRISESDKAVIEKAAEINHLSLASYVSSTILKQAEIDIHNNEAIFLGKEDAKLVMDLLSSPPEPNVRLIQLFKQ